MQLQIEEGGFIRPKHRQTNKNNELEQSNPLVKLSLLFGYVIKIFNVKNALIDVLIIQLRYGEFSYVLHAMIPMYIECLYPNSVCFFGKNHIQ